MSTGTPLQNTNAVQLTCALLHSNTPTKQWCRKRVRMCVCVQRCNYTLTVPCSTVMGRRRGKAPVQAEQQAGRDPQQPHHSNPSPEPKHWVGVAEGQVSGRKRHAAHLSRHDKRIIAGQQQCRGDKEAPVACLTVPLESHCTRCSVHEPEPALDRGRAWCGTNSVLACVVHLTGGEDHRPQQGTALAAASSLCKLPQQVREVRH